MTSGRSNLPYFDFILECLHQRDADVTEAFSRHVHWGYWDDPGQSDGSISDFAAAAERLSQEVITAAGVCAGERVLDVGCGFGGTLAELNQRFAGMHLFGLNIDVRQLSYADGELLPLSNNRVNLVGGDACRLPFLDASFDVVLCVEAVFHFAGRDRFFAEVRRVLRPGGRLVLTDFVPRFVVPLLWDYFERRVKPKITRLYGPSNMRCTLAGYRELGRLTGMPLTGVRDVTWHTLPSHRVMRPLVRRIGPDPDGAEEVIKRVQFTMRIGLIRYLILTFVVPVAA